MIYIGQKSLHSMNCMIAFFIIKKYLCCLA
nr:MAG TPA: hypothetical protein [Caudoviricetes sp.]